ncbi:MAG: alpha/beta hydrolase fold domain-containing protein [Pseudomonadota bacterium]
MVYGTGETANGSFELLLDVYQPAGACTEPRPFVVGIHGGGFTGGSRSNEIWVGNMEAIAGRGFVGFSIDYRLVGDQPVPSNTYQPVVDDLMREADRLGLAAAQRDTLNASVAAMEDTVTALEWAVENAEDRCLDPERFALWGSSAGAITALHVSHALDDYFIVRPEPLVVIDYWGRLFLEGQVGTHGPPMMIIHGTADQTVIYEESALLLAAEADAAFLPYAFYIIEGGPHGFGSVDPARVQINGESPLEITLDFIEDHLRDGSPNYETQSIVPQG